MRTILSGIVLTGLFIGCETADDEDTGLDDQLIQTVESGLEEVAEGLAEVNDSGGTSLALSTPTTKAWQKVWNGSLLQNFWAVVKPAPVYAAEFTVGCVTTQRPDAGFGLGQTGVTDVEVIRTFEDCGRRLVQVNGRAYLEYAGLNDGFPEDGTVISRAADVIRTHSFYDGFAHFRGASDETLQLDEDSEALPVAQRFTFNSFNSEAGTASYTIESNAQRDLYLEGGNSPHRSHLISSELNVEREGSSRTVNGTIIVENETDDFTTTITMTDVEWDVSQCYPASGTVTFTVTGSRDGEGTITLDADNLGDVPVEYTGDGEVSSDASSSVTAEKSGVLQSKRIRRRIRTRLRRARRLVRLAGCRN